MARFGSLPEGIPEDSKDKNDKSSQEIMNSFLYAINADRQGQETVEYADEEGGHVSILLVKCNYVDCQASMCFEPFSKFLKLITTNIWARDAIRGGGLSARQSFDPKCCKAVMLC